MVCEGYSGWFSAPDSALRVASTYPSLNFTDHSVSDAVNLSTAYVTKGNGCLNKTAHALRLVVDSGASFCLQLFEFLAEETAVVLPFEALGLPAHNSLANSKISFDIVIETHVRLLFLH